MDPEWLLPTPEQIQEMNTLAVLEMQRSHAWAKWELEQSRRAVTEYFAERRRALPEGPTPE